jgi:hypothetical protein
VLISSAFLSGDLSFYSGIIATFQNSSLSTGLRPNHCPPHLSYNQITTTPLSFPPQSKHNFEMTEVITDPTPPILLHGPSDKEKKYDRQLRLWAASGQQALEDAHILLINSGSGTVGVETLKNLVLPGKAYVSDAELQADRS